MFNMATVTFIGVSPLLLGIAAIRSGRYPAALGVIAVLGGTAGILTGLAGLGGAEGDDLTIPFLAASLLVTIWAIGAGVVLLRTADREPVPA
jgi:hypothetical protein